MKNHSYQDGNKRTSLLAAVAFMYLNKKMLKNGDLDDVELANAQVACCTGQWTAEQLGQYYKTLMHKAVV